MCCTCEMDKKKAKRNAILRLTVYAGVLLMTIGGYLGLY